MGTLGELLSRGIAYLFENTNDFIDGKAIFDGDRVSEGAPFAYWVEG